MKMSLKSGESLELTLRLKVFSLEQILWFSLLVHKKLKCNLNLQIKV